MSSSDVLFHQADTNRDGVLSEGEFRNLVTRNSTVGSDINYLGGGGYSSSSYETSTNGGAFGGDINYTGTGFGTSGSSAAFRSSVGNVGGGLANVNITGANGDAALVGYSSASQSSAVQQYETDGQGNFRDSNPQVIRRPAPDGPLTYQQNIRVRFLQPPAVPPPGPLIIREVRPPQPPAPTPLRVRQQAPPLPTPPPLILRERPPPVPAAVASQTVVRNLTAIPVPPRSVIIERLPSAPPKPRDIIIERWIPYGAMAKRRTVVQRAEAAKAYQAPRNIIIQYEAPQVRVIRQFQRLGVTPENPQAYLQRYGATLFDSQTLVQQARAAGVVEDISVPAGSSSSEFSSSSFNGSFGTESNNDVGVIGGGGRASRSSFYESSSYSANGDVSNLGAGFGEFGRSTSYNSSADTAFSAADSNNDGVLSQAEFRNAGY